MEQQEQPRWRPTGRQVLWTVGVGIALVALVVLVRIGYAYRWTGFGQAKVNEAARPAKTLWDWLNLLIIPFVIAVVGTVGGYFFARSENRAAQSIADRRAQDEALQAYLDQIGHQLFDKEFPLRKTLEAQSLARARTLTLLQRLDAKHKRSVLQFLSEAGLIVADAPESWSPSAPCRNPPTIKLKDANFDHADLSEMRLGHVDLSKVTLRGADMSNFHLGWVQVMVVVRVSRLDDADLSFAKLHRAKLLHTFMKGAIFRNADLTGALLSGADLTNADLTGADLSEANLSGARGISNEELEQQAKSLEGATMPNGQKYEEWLKSREVGDSGS